MPRRRRRSGISKPCAGSTMPRWATYRTTEQFQFPEYGASTTPTLVLLDAAGVVRLYHPGNLSFPDLAAAYNRLLKK